MLSRALMVGAMILATGASSAQTLEQALETALGRFTQVQLPAADAVRYELIFDLQNSAAWAEADQEISHLTDDRLMGYVRLQRYMHPQSGRTSFESLTNWLRNYGDHPGAVRIYDLAERRRPDGAGVPGYTEISTPGYGEVERYGVEACSYERRRDGDLNRQIHQLIQNDRMSQARSLLEEREASYSLIDFDRAMGQIAAGYFFYGMPAEALETARPAADRSGGYAPQAAWIVAMAAWHYGDYTGAARYFEIMATAECASAWGRTAGAYWAARSHLRDRRPQESMVWLNQAAAYPRTFYGLLANRALGVEPALDFAPPELTDAGIQALSASERGQRAIALVQARQGAWADRELVQLATETRDPVLLDGIVAFAQRAGLPQSALATAAIRQPSPDRFYDGALYPLGSWEPSEGYQIDPALLHAVAREESRFNPRAESPAGASGLLQIVPSTATYVHGESFTGAAQARLLLPDLNLSVGQAYLERLMGQSNIESDLLKTVIAYNAGPGNLSRWLNGVNFGDDPLYLIEALTLGETRAYVERVMASFWIYRIRLNQDTPSLDAMAAGDWPIYVAQGPVNLRQVAARGE